MVSVERARGAHRCLIGVETTQGVAVASLLSSLRRGVRFELSGSLSGFEERDADHDDEQ